MTTPISASCTYSEIPHFARWDGGEAAHFLAIDVHHDDGGTRGGVDQRRDQPVFAHGQLRRRDLATQAADPHRLTVGAQLRDESSRLFTRHLAEQALVGVARDVDVVLVVRADAPRPCETLERAGPQDFPFGRDLQDEDALGGFVLACSDQVLSPDHDHVARSVDRHIGERLRFIAHGKGPVHGARTHMLDAVA
jgi:hypothetical protein